MTKWNYLIAVTIYIVIPTLLIVSIVLLHKKKKYKFIWITYLLVFLFGLFLGPLFHGHFIEYPRHQSTMASQAKRLLGVTTMLREGKTQEAIGYLDIETSWRLIVSAWERDMESLPPEIMDAWQSAKVYYDKYEVASSQYGPDRTAYPC